MRVGNGGASPPRCPTIDMTASIADQNSFVCGAVQRADLAYLTVVIDEFALKRVPHGILMQCQAGRFQRIAPAKWNIVSLAVLRRPTPCLVALGETGLVIVASAGSLQHEDVGAAAATGSVVPLRSVTAVGSNAYAVGMRRQAYQRSADGTWRAIHGDMLEAPNTEAVHGFEAVIGVSESEIYAAGWEGEIWRFDGARWFRVPSPTNLIITSLACAADGQVHACGQAGLSDQSALTWWAVAWRGSMGTSPPSSLMRSSTTPSSPV